MKYTRNTPSYPVSPHKYPLKQPLNAPPIPQEALTLSRKVDGCKPLVPGIRGEHKLLPADPVRRVRAAADPAQDVQPGLRHRGDSGKAVQVRPIKPTLKAPAP